MKNYYDYQLTDLLFDESFIRWVRQESLPADDLFWQEWLSQHPHKQALVDQARMLILDIKIKPYRDISSPEVEEELEKIRARTYQKPFVFSRKSNRLPNWVRVAAVIMLVLGIGWLVWPLRSGDKTPTYAELVQQAGVPLVEKVNETTKPLVVSLPDGSQVILQPASRISYSGSFQGDSRDVYLTGEAFFEVKRNPRRPFYVYANDLVTKVLGTSFTVKSYEDQPHAQVTVLTGRVSVFTNQFGEKTEKSIDREIPGVVLIPNQRAVLDRQNGHLHRTLRPDPVILDPHFATNLFVFDETPVAEAFTRFEKAYGVDIVFDEQLLKECTLTAKFKDEPMLEKLNLICQTIKASYQIVDAQIVISAEGCY